MKIAVILLLALVPLASAEEGKKCWIQDGNDLRQFEEENNRKLPIKVPCKFNMILQQCGDYRVTVTPGLRFLYPDYIIESVWLGVKNTTSGQYWEGRTTNKMTAKYIIDKTNRTFFNYKDGNYTAEELFDVTNTTQNVTLTEKNGVFSLTVGAYDFNGNKHRDSRLEFVCNVDNNATAYPKQYCGSYQGKEIKDRAEAVFKKKNDHHLLTMYDIFNDSSIVQVKQGCQDATHVFTNVCNETQRKEAIETCHHILDSTGHTKCVLKTACDPLDVFVNCLKYVCSDYTDMAACKEVGQAIDLCRNFPGLTERVKAEGKKCYDDFLTAEDNPHYKKKD